MGNSPSMSRSKHRCTKATRKTLSNVPSASKTQAMRGICVCGEGAERRGNGKPLNRKKILKGCLIQNHSNRHKKSTRKRKIR